MDKLVRENGTGSKSGYRDWTKELSRLTKLDRLSRFVRSEGCDYQNKRLEVSCQDVTVIESVGTRLVRHRVSVLMYAETQSDVIGRCTSQDIIELLLELKEFTAVGFRS
ncbi:hypothetical protein F2Q69_00034972 [Brassica cretica]|uniref:Uncharacterized protein n=1 Tax=Brassica cretica TaxID=69181 RepID=A0A8S9SGC0_BRACR|nr:hypothetical protein F2Q69_00034972 [Brassica cretica]